MIAALFDCDGTLYTGQFGRGLMRYAALNGHGLQSRLLYASLIPSVTLRRMRLLSGAESDRIIMVGLARLLRGWDQHDLQAAFAWLVTEYLFPTRRPEIMAKLREHQAQGHAVVLVSGSFQGALDVMTRSLGVAGGVGTKLDMVDGYCAGVIIPPLIKDEHKVTGARIFFVARQQEIDWAASYAYADSISDKDMLNMVGHPVAVYPDRELTKLAKDKGWEIIGTPR